LRLDLHSYLRWRHFFNRYRWFFKLCLVGDEIFKN
jgi:hypothetical protein